jgi:SAM-dependent methyltransferase
VGARGAAAHLGIELREYDARIRTFIPGYERLLRAAADALKTTVRSGAPLVVDLGIGSGALAAACAAAAPRARFHGIDAEAGMLEAARTRLGRRLHTTVHDSFERADLPRCGAVVASLALHHIPTAKRRRRLFRRVRAALAPGGVLISADCHPSSNARLAAADRAAWIAHLEQSYTSAEARRYLRIWAREDHYATLEDELATLRRARFHVDVRLRSGAFAVIAAFR